MTEAGCLMETELTFWSGCLNRSIFTRMKTDISEKMIPMTKKSGLARLFIREDKTLFRVAFADNQPGEIQEESSHSD